MLGGDAGEEEFGEEGRSIEMMTITEIASLCHEANRIYCDIICTETQPTWVCAPDWQRTSAINGVRFHMDNPEAGPEASHVRWLKEKEAEGWRYGPVKNAENKEHPCFMPYEQLPEEQRLKDSLFLAIVNCFRT